MEQLLDAAAAVFAEQGYARATTNAIAARAGVSPGSLYQFFANKEAMADALAERYLQWLEVAHEAALPPDLGDRSLDAVLDQVIDPLVEFNLANPAYHALFKEPDAPDRWASATERLHESLMARLDAILAALAPDAPPDERQRTARVSVHIFGGLLPMILEAGDTERPQVVAELKRALMGYLRPVARSATSTR